MRLCLLASFGLLPSVVLGQEVGFDYANFTVEAVGFRQGEEEGRYSTTGSFQGIGFLYFSPARQIIWFRGLKQIEVPYMGQEPDDKYEFFNDSFTITSIIRTGTHEYAFQGVRDGRIERTITGVIHVSQGTGTLGDVIGQVTEFRLDEHGQMLEGVMNRYTLPTSPQAEEMLSKYPEVFFGGNAVLLEPEQVPPDP